MKNSNSTIFIYILVGVVLWAFPHAFGNCVSVVVENPCGFQRTETVLIPFKGKYPGNCVSQTIPGEFSGGVHGTTNLLISLNLVPFEKKVVVLDALSELQQPNAQAFGMRRGDRGYIVSNDVFSVGICKEGFYSWSRLHDKHDKYELIGDTAEFKPLVGWKHGADCTNVVVRSMGYVRIVVDIFYHDGEIRRLTLDRGCSFVHICVIVPKEKIVRETYWGVGIGHEKDLIVDRDRMWIAACSEDGMVFHGKAVVMRNPEAESSWVNRQMAYSVWTGDNEACYLMGILNCRTPEFYVGFKNVIYDSASENRWVDEVYRFECSIRQESRIKITYKHNPM